MEHKEKKAKIKLANSFTSSDDFDTNVKIYEQK